MATSYIRPDLFRYPSRRSGVYARNMVVTSQPLAVQAGLDALKGGGNAVDAALACAICLTVVEPTGNGIGSDAFALIQHGGALHGFNGSGRSPAAWDIERFGNLDEMPKIGWEAVTVPGAVDAWVKISARFGRLPFESLFEAAIRYAREGYAVSPVVQRMWREALPRYAHLDGFRSTFMPGGDAPAVGQSFRNPGQADTLEDIARTRGESFYRGALADAIAEDASRHGAAMTRSDLAAHEGQWVDPISIDYGGLTVHELPPNGQGLAALIALGILDSLNIQRFAPDSADALHLQIEAMKLAFADTFAQVADPHAMTIEPSRLLDRDRLGRLAARIDIRKAAAPMPAMTPDRGTVYLCTADADGVMVSMIQSNFEGFGSGIVVPGTGISLHNRGAGFTLDSRHPNGVAGNKLPFHTIMPGFLSSDGRPFGAIGVMGGHMQAQGHVQLVCRLHDFGQDLQEAIDAPRWYVTEQSRVALEDGIEEGVRDDLKSRGHRVQEPPSWRVFGGAQALVACAEGFHGASDPRKDGCAGGF